VIGFELVGGPAVEMLDRIESRLQNTRPVMAQLVDDFHDLEQDAFASAGFGSWAPDSAETVAYKGSSRVLVDTGALMSSLVHGGALSLSDDEVTFGTSVRAAPYLKRGARGAPPRDPIPDPPPERVELWAEQIARYVAGGAE
jgi:hypothetical protein